MKKPTARVDARHDIEEEEKKSRAASRLENKRDADATKSRALATRKASPPSNLVPFREKFKEKPGKGLSTAQDDNVVPIVRRLQDLSPQVKKSKPEYIKGAEPGDIWLKDHDPMLIKGSDGFLFQPCGFSKDIVEWRDRDEGGGFVRRWDKLPPNAKEEVDEKSGRTFYTHNGNPLVDTRYHAGFIIDENTGEASPWVIPMKGTDHQVSRAWMSRMNAKRIDGVKADSWMFIYRFTTKDKTNAVGQSWATWDIADVGEIETDEEYYRGLALFEAFSSGEKRAETDEDESQPSSRSTGPSDTASM